MFNLFIKAMRTPIPSLKWIQEHIGVHRTIAEWMKELNGDWMPGPWTAEKKLWAFG